MSSIDSRVVQLSFDNDQFESAVKTTMNSLSDLESSLDFGSSVSNFDQITSAAKSVDLTSIESSLSALQSRFSTFGTVCTTVIVNLTNTILNTLGSAVSTITSTLSSVASTAISGGITRVLNLEQAYFSLEGLLDTEEEVEAVMANVSEAVDGTAYSLDSAANVASSLVASGLEAGDELLSSLQAIAGVAAQTGSEYSDIGSIFTTVAGNGKLMTEQLRQFSYRGLNAAATLADYLGTTESEIYEMVSDGEISFQTFSDAMYEAFGDHAKDANKTFSGVCSNISSALSRVGALFVDEILANEGPLVEFLNSLRVVINNIKTELEDVADIWETWAISVLNQASDVLDNLDITGLFEVFNEVVDILVDHFGPVVNKVVDAVLNLVEGINDISVDGASEALNTLSTVLDVLFEVTDNLLGVIKPIASGIADIFEAIVQGFNDVFGLSIEDIGDVLVKITQSMEDFVQSIGLTDEGLESITALSEAFFKVVKLGVGVVEEVADIFGRIVSSDVWKNLGSVFLDIIGIVGTAISDFIDSIEEIGVVETISTTLSTILSNLDSMLTGVSEGLGGFSGLLKTALETSSSLLEGLLKVVSNVFGGIVDVIGSVVSWITEHVSLGDVFAGLIGTSVFKFFQSLADVVNNISQIIAIFKSGGVASLVTFGDGITGVLTNVKNVLKSMTQSISISSIVAIAGSVFVLALAMSTISEIDSEKLLSSMGALVTIVAALVGLMQTSSVVAKGLQAESFLSMGASILLIAYAIKVLSSAVINLSDMNIAELATSLVGLGGLVVAIKSLMKSMSKISTKDVSSVDVFIELAAIVIAMKIMVGALEDLSQMSLEEIAKGVVGMAAILVELESALAILGKMGKSESLDFSSVKTNVLGLIGVAVVVMLASDTLTELSQLKWEEIAKGITGLAGILVVMVAALKVLSNVFTTYNKTLTTIQTGSKETAKMSTNLLTNVKSIIGLAVALVLMGYALEKIGSLSWEQIGKGLTGCAGVLAEFLIVLAILSGIKTNRNVKTQILSLAGIAVVLLIVAADLYILGSMSWEMIGKGLAAAGVALSEFVVVMAILSKIKNSASVLLNVIAMGLLSVELLVMSVTLEKFGSMPWETISRGLIAMAGALSGMTAVIAILALIGAGSIAALVGVIAMGVLVLELDPLADALAKFGAMSWDEIGRGLTAMLGALLVLGASSFVSTIGIIGSLGIAAVSESLSDLADAVKAFADIGEDAQSGIATMAEALAVIAVGSIANSLGIIGSLSISVIAEPLGELAESLMLWQSVSVPDGLGESLQAVADGISCFGVGNVIDALVTSAIAEPLGDLANSVMMWQGVSVPSGLGANLKMIADGIAAFSVDDVIGALVTSVVAEPLGELAEAVMAWSDISLLDGMTIMTNLTALATGIGAFGDAQGILGSLSITLLADELGDLATSVQAWEGITLPEGMKESLIDLAEGVSAFAPESIGDFFSASTISNVTTPLTELATAASAWTGIELPDSISGKMTSLAEGVDAFSTINYGNIKVQKINDLATAMADMSNPLSNLNSVRYTYITNGLVNLSSSIESISSLDTSNIASSLYSLASSITDTADSFGNAGYDLGVELVLGVGYGVADTSNISSIASNLYLVASSVTDTADAFGNAGYDLGVELVIGIGVGASDTEAITGVCSGLDELASSLYGASDRFQDVSLFIGEMIGYVIGIGVTDTEAITGVCSGLDELASSLYGASDRFQDVSLFIGEMIAYVIGVGISDSSKDVTSKLQLIATASQTTIRSKYSLFYNAGAYLTQGLAAGITSKKYQVVSAAQVVAKAALTAAQKALDESSPSKATQKMGIYFDEGLSLGIESASGEVENVATAIGLGTLSSLSSALSGASSVMADSMSFDTSGMSDYAKVMSSSITASGNVQSATATMQQALLEDNLKMFEANNQLATELSELRNDMGSYTSALSNMETTMYVDGRKLASTIAKPMNQSLSTLSKRGRLS